MRLPVALIALLPTVWAACIPVSGDRILGSHLALADPALAALPASMTAGFSPAPGTQRVFATAEITRLAKAGGITLQAPPPDACFELSMRLISGEEAAAVMRSVLPAGTTIEVVELPKTLAPLGDIHFPVTSLEPGPDIRLWRGYVQYTSTRRSPVWARVRVRTMIEALVLTSDIARGGSIPETAYEVRPVSGLPIQIRVATRPEDVAGAVARVALKAGETIPLAALEHPPTVRRGDVIRVDVRSGTTHLQLEAVAQREARNGDVVNLLNPVSGKTFRARIEGSMAVVAVGGHR